MNSQEVTENWNELIFRLKQRFVFLTNDDLKFSLDDKEVLFSELRIKFGKTVAEFDKIIASI